MAGCSRQVRYVGDLDEGLCGKGMSFCGVRESFCRISTRGLSGTPGAPYGRKREPVK